ncbi:hypothetical protein BD414DRAFT_522972 [Trametes punicea]|nr:hypothetical protein BD414DRAFT_522972 [Trametes punicea]
MQAYAGRLRSVLKKLADDNPAAAAAFVHQNLDGRALDNPSRFRLYERSISSFLRYGDVMKAAILYSRMTREGYIPSIALRVQMHMVKLAELSVTEEQLLDIACDAFGNPSFDEQALRDILHTLVEGLGASPELVRRIVNEFVKTRESGFTLSNDTVIYLLKVHQKAGDEDGARYWSAYPSASRQDSADPHSHPYTTLLRDLAASKPSFSVYKWTLERMQADNVQADLPFYNALLAHEVGRRNYEVVFAIYRLLIEKRSTTVLPQAQTFAPVFRAIHRLSCSHRYRRANGIRVPPNMPSPRAVYKDMLTCHLEATRWRPNRSSPVLDTTVLHRALRTFLARHDYAAAYTVVRAFRYFPAAVGQPTIATYRIVYGGILGRIKVEFPQMAVRLASGLDLESVWASRFLGARLTLDLSMIYRVLRVGTDPRLGLDFVSAPEWNPRQSGGPTLLEGDDMRDLDLRLEAQDFHSHGMPSPLEFADLQPVPDNQTYSLVPLERALKRAIAASFPPEHEPLARQMSAAIAEAKRAMVVKW